MSNPALVVTPGPVGQPYLSTPVVGGEDKPGYWFRTDKQAVLTVTVALDADGGAVTGYLYAEITADKAGAAGVSRVCFPYGALHRLGTLPVQFSADADQVDVTAGGSLSFTLSFSYPGRGRMRFGWHTTTAVGGAGGENVKLFTDAEPLR